MLKSFWTLFFLSLGGILLFLSLLVLDMVFIRKLFLAKAYGLIKFAAVAAGLLFLIIISSVTFVHCCMDYHYIASGTFEEEKAKVVEFTYSKKDYDGNGQIINSRPKFLLVDRWASSYCIS